MGRPGRELLRVPHARVGRERGVVEDRAGRAPRVAGRRAHQQRRERVEGEHPEAHGHLPAEARAVREHERPHAIRVPGREGHRDRAAERVADRRHGTRDARRVDVRGQRVGQRLQRGRSDDGIRPAEPGQVEAVQLVAGGEAGVLLVPVLEAAADAVQEEERIPGAGHAVPHPPAADVEHRGPRGPERIDVPGCGHVATLPRIPRARDSGDVGRRCDDGGAAHRSAFPVARSHEPARRAAIDPGRR